MLRPKIRDLLTPPAAVAESVTLLEDREGRVHLKGAQEVGVANAEALRELLGEEGGENDDDNNSRQETKRNGTGSTTWTGGGRKKRRRKRNAAKKRDQKKISQSSIKMQEKDKKERHLRDTTVLASLINTITKLCQRGGKNVVRSVMEHSNLGYYFINLCEILKIDMIKVL